MKANEHIKYWIDSSDDDFQAMIHLLEKGDNTWSLFIGHLVLEKLLKAWYVKVNSNTFTKEWVHNIEEFREWIKKKLLK